MKDRSFRCSSGIAFSSYLLVLALILSLPLAGCGGNIIIKYDESPENLVVEYSTGGGLAPLTEDQIPDFMLFGDGRVVKDSEESATGLMVEGKLDPAGVKKLLEEIEATGFFGLKDEYFNREVMDAPGSRMSVSLTGHNKSVYVYAMDVKGFDDAVDAVMNFPLENQKPYVPESGYLFANAVDPAGVEDDRYAELAEVLPSIEDLRKADETSRPVEIDGETFAKLKKLESEKESYGIEIIVDGSAYRVFPVYVPSDRL
ncbi:MAG: hypothetical protein JW738_07840 [Actinobacteria bacterium]|nr:hypothetical protein [Actinomycetota bacterium]